MSRRSYNLWHPPRQWTYFDQFGPEDPAWDDDDDDGEEPEPLEPEDPGEFYQDYGGEG